jgi:hypothetical protein
MFLTRRVDLGLPSLHDKQTSIVYCFPASGICYSSRKQAKTLPLSTVSSQQQRHRDTEPPSTLPTVLFTVTGFFISALPYQG